MLRPVQFPDAGDGEGGTSGAGDARAHPVEKIGEVHHLRFARGTFNGGHAFGQHGGHHYVRCAEDRRAGASAQEHVAPRQPRGVGAHVTAFDSDARAQFAETFQVQINWARSDDTATGQRDTGATQPAHQRAKNANRAAHLADQIVVAHTFDPPSVQGECVAVEFHLGAE